MRFTEVEYDTGTPLTGYGPGFFRLGTERVDGPALVMPGYAGAWGGLEDTDRILACADRIDVLFLGMGAEIAHAPPAFRAALEDAGIGVEVMASPTACRSYNVLLGEGRRVAAALLPVGGPSAEAEA